MSIFSISDIHGCDKTFAAMLDKIGLSKQDELFLLGDYIDRGHASKQVLDRIMKLKESGYKVTALRGNHEQMMLESSNTKENGGYNLLFWMQSGGRQTLDSFAIDGNIPNSIQDIPESYLDFCHSMEYYVESKGFIFVHAGLNFKNEQPPFDCKEDMLWIRKWTDNINYDWLQKRIIVHGHTPQTRYEIEERFSELDEWQALNIDNSCVFNKQGYNHLCCVDLTKMELHFQKCID